MIDVIKRNSTFYFLFLPVLIVSTMVLKYVGLLVLLGGLVLFTQKRRYDLIIVTFIVILIFSDNLNPRFDMFKNMRILILLYTVMLSISVILQYEKGLDRRLLYFTPFFIAGFIASYFFSPSLSASVIRDISYFLLVFSMFTFFRFTYRQLRESLSENILVLLMIIYGISFLGIFPPLNSSFFVGSRLSGLMGNPNGLALLSVLSYPLVDYLESDNKEISPRVIKLLKFLIVVCLLFTGSRNGLVSLFIYIVLRALFTQDLLAKVFSVIAMVAALTVILNLQAILQSVPQLHDYTRAGTIEDASGRVQVWAVAMEEIQRNPWIGKGNYYYNIYFDDYARTYGLVARQWFSVWNSYLAFLLDSGFIGLAAYAIFLFGLIRYSRSWKRSIPFLGAALFSAIFETWLVASLNAFTPMFLLYFVISQKNEDDEDTNII